VALALTTGTVGIVFVIVASFWVLLGLAAGPSLIDLHMVIGVTVEVYPIVKTEKWVQ
jgi:hypothetical protein